MPAITASRTSRRLRGLALLASAFIGVALVSSTSTPAHADPVSDAEEQMEKQFTDLEAVVEEYNKIKVEFDETKEQVEALEEELKPFEDQLSVLYEKVGAIASNVYMGGSMNGLTAVFTTGSPDDLADRITMLDQATVDDSSAIDELNTAKADLDERKAVLDGLYTQQSEQEAELGEKKKAAQEGFDRLSEQRDKAYRDKRGLSDDAFVPPFVPGKRGEVVRFALAQVGDAYDMNAAGPDAWDCSGLTMGAWSQVGVHLSHNAAAQWNSMRHISRGDLQPGDLVFYNGLNHVAMYIGGDHVVHASDYGIGVIVSTVDKAGSSYYGAARPSGW